MSIILKEKYGSGVGAIDSHVTLYGEGDFWNSMRMALIQGGFNIDADFNKSDGHIYKNFTRDFSDQEDFEAKVMGLSDTELENMLSNMINPMLLKEMNAFI